MDIKQDVRIVLESEQGKGADLAKKLAQQLSLPPPSQQSGDVPFSFVYRKNQLQLFVRLDGKQHGPLFVDFLSGPSLYRYHRDRRISQPLARAVGVKKGVRPSICDVTAGLGGDSFVLAALGCPVTMTERSPLVWALLDDGIRRALYHPRIGEIFRKRVSLHLHEAKSFVSCSKRSYDTIYMDPMYPQRKKSALNKQDMRLLRMVVGSDDDSLDLLRESLDAARKRVVVKRPAGAPFLEEPSFTIKGKSSRFDVYLAAHL